MSKRKDRIFMRPDMRGNGKMVETEKHHCETPFCRGLVNRKTEKNIICSACKRARWKANNPLRYAFGNLRRRAKQRGKEFTLTFDQYKHFAESTDYHKLKGKSSLSLSVDRIDDRAGYEWWNIQAITLRENTRKQFVPFFARQMENEAYKPSTAEVRAVFDSL